MTIFWLRTLFPYVMHNNETLIVFTNVSLELYRILVIVNKSSGLIYGFCWFCSQFKSIDWF